MNLCCWGTGGLSDLLQSVTRGSSQKFVKNTDFCVSYFMDEVQVSTRAI